MAYDPSKPQFWQVRLSFLRLDKSYRDNADVGVLAFGAESAINYAKQTLPKGVTNIAVWLVVAKGQLDVYHLNDDGRIT